MQRILAISLLIFSINLNCYNADVNCASGEAIQIVTPENHQFNLELNNLKQILEADEIKDRNVAVISIAGAFRKGKSFLLNFFIRYLCAEYKRHDITDWIGENSNVTELTGFKWRGGRKPETTGMWMWSEIFTHDYETGEKVAIILIDTQGVFDSRSSVKDCTVTFALSTLLSSVLCFNVMANIQEDDLNHLKIFTDYARLAKDQSSRKPFQNLLFIVRDWPYADEISYGWNGQKVIDELLTENNEQTNEMRQLRRGIQANFDEISAYLLPYPGVTVARSKNFTGILQQIDEEFLNSINELVPAILAPKNLVIKHINDHKIRARDLVHYFETYVNIFNGNSLPDPGMVFAATAEVSNLILLNDCVNVYASSMQKELNEIVSYLNPSDLEETHVQAKIESLALFKSKRKLGDSNLILSFEHRLENAIQEKLVIFRQENENKRIDFIEKAHSHNYQIYNKIITNFEKKAVQGRSDLKADDDFNKFIQQLKQGSLEEFDNRKIGNDEISNYFRDKLLQDIEKLETKLKSSNSAAGLFVLLGLLGIAAAAG